MVEELGSESVQTVAPAFPEFWEKHKRDRIFLVLTLKKEADIKNLSLFFIVSSLSFQRKLESSRINPGSRVSARDDKVVKYT
jgi:hypothetical protein